MSEALAEIIRAEITGQGAITFRRYMELALYHPELGYYSSGRARIGRRGDFFTNVSVGPLFGKLLARQVAEMWGNLGRPGSFAIVEQGANDGQLALDVLRGLEELAPGCLAATVYRIVEPSPSLAEMQRRALSGQQVEWFANLGEMPAFRGVHLSNELIDAFPVHVVEWSGLAWQERCVTASGGHFAFCSRPLSSPELAEACSAIPQPLPAGYVTEVNLLASRWIAEVAARLEDGYVLAIDYGHPRDIYYDSNRAGGTLSAYASHRRENDPLARPGEIDLTAHVEFTGLIDAARAAGMRIAGFTDQHHFMVGLGADHFAKPADPAELRAFQTLMHPSLMGQVFKVAGFEKGSARGALAGFRFARPGAA